MGCVCTNLPSCRKWLPVFFFFCLLYYKFKKPSFLPGHHFANFGWISGSSRTCTMLYSLVPSETHQKKRKKQDVPRICFYILLMSKTTFKAKVLWQKFLV